MKWVKQGLVYGPNGRYSWARHSALTPTPILRPPDTIRVYAGFRDESGVSRIGFVDLQADDPSEVKRVSREPVLDIGAPGAFDDNGVILGDSIEHDGKLYMYYVGFQLVKKAKFLAFTGLAISVDGGDTFKRYSQTPVLDRSDEGLYIRAIHSVMIEDGVWKIWYASGNGWRWINGAPYPFYHIKYQESPDGIHFQPEGLLCVDVQGDEYRIGRPRVYRCDAQYAMFYTRGAVSGDYIAGYAASPDGKRWTRRDDALGIGLSPAGWDSKALCYPALLTYNNRTYMFYNGHDMGRDGFGYAVLATD